MGEGDGISKPENGKMTSGTCLLLNKPNYRFDLRINVNKLISYCIENSDIISRKTSSVFNYF